jgi:hypothetical protein
MEDSFWESIYNSSLHDEHFSIKQNASSIDFYQKQENLFNTNVRYVKDNKIKLGTLSKPYLKDQNLSINSFALPVFSNEPILNTSLINYKDLEIFPNDLLVDSSEEGYESSKYINYMYYLNYKSLLNGYFNNVQPVSYASVFDSFRSDYEDPYLYSDDYTDNESLMYSNQLQSDTNSNIKLSNPFKLRSTVKNSMVTYSAIQKVFRSRFDEGRSNTRLEDFSNSYVKHPYISDTRTNYESLLGKNKEFFLQPVFYNQTNKLNSSLLSPLYYSNNIYFMDLPFLTSMKSDPSRYL